MQVDTGLHRAAVVCQERLPARLLAWVGSWSESREDVSIYQGQVLILVGDIVVGFDHQILDCWCKGIPPELLILVRESQTGAENDIWESQRRTHMEAIFLM